MIKNNKGESFAGIIIGVFILSIVLMGILSILINSRDLIIKFQDKTIIDILKNNTTNIIKRINLDNLESGDTFYLYKNNTTKTFDIISGSLGEDYKYINKNGEKIDNPLIYEGDVYYRVLGIKRFTQSGEEKMIVKVVLKKLVRN